ncbi:MAG: DNA repair protein RecN [Bacilli bacterium]|nr:DNA repair protein RecN [Bacilli bacterium]
MLRRLLIKNWAIIEDADITFRDGLTVLTGETGAGKSLIIDSITLLSGDRASVEMIRQGSDKASVVGYFNNLPMKTINLLNRIGINDVSDEIVISRTISLNKNVIKINDTNVTLNDLKTITASLIDIHNQFEMIKLFNKDNYLEIIDGFKSEIIEEYIEKYLSSLSLFNNKKKEHLSLVEKVKKYQENKEQYEYDLKEIQALSLRENEEEEIKEEITLLRHFEDIHSLLDDAKNVIDEGLIDKLYQVRNDIKNLSSFQNEYLDMSNQLDNYYYELEAIFEDIKHKHHHLDFKAGRLDELEDRLNAINHLKKKHHKDVNELIIYQKELETLIASSEDFSVLLNESEKELRDRYDEAYQKAKDISFIREKISRNIEKELERNLDDLLLKTKFKVSLVQKEKEDDLSGNIFSSRGIDEVDFLIETNIGEGLKPLNKVVSGGEASRIMLAIKTLFIKAKKTPIVIFDEADSGISGEVASKVANKIYEISHQSQVIVITHLPQLASLSKHHLKISKFINKGRTYTSIKELSLEERIYEVASLISDGEVTKAQLEYASEMITNKE